MVVSPSCFSYLNWQLRECISSVTSRRASLNFRDELLSGVSIPLALSSEECKWSAVECGVVSLASSAQSQLKDAEAREVLTLDGLPRTCS